MGRGHWIGNKKGTHMFSVPKMFCSKQQTMSTHLVTCIMLEMKTYGLFFQRACSLVSQKYHNIDGQVVGVLIEVHVK